MAYDPIPPETSVESVYDAFHERIQVQMNPYRSDSPLLAFLRSLLPWIESRQTRNGQLQGLIEAEMAPQRQAPREIIERLQPGEFPDLLQQNENVNEPRESIRGLIRGLLDHLGYPATDIDLPEFQDPQQDEN